jgi:hypothetical protein
MRQFFVMCVPGANRSMLLCCAFLATFSLCRPLTSAAESVSTGIDWIAAGFLQGDANHDTHVNYDDFSIVYFNYGSEGSWEAGDFDNDGIVGFSDLNYVVGNFGLNYMVAASDSGPILASQIAGSAPASGAHAVPEPGTFALLAAALAGLLALRWKRPV